MCAATQLEQSDPCRPPLQAFIGPDTLKCHRKLDPASFSFRIQLEQELKRLQLEEHEVRLLQVEVAIIELDLETESTLKVVNKLGEQADGGQATTRVQERINLNVKVAEDF